MTHTGRRRWRSGRRPLVAAGGLSGVELGQGALGNPLQHLLGEDSQELPADVKRFIHRPVVVGACRETDTTHLHSHSAHTLHIRLKNQHTNTFLTISFVKHLMHGFFLHINNKKNEFNPITKSPVCDIWLDFWYLYWSKFNTLPILAHSPSWLSLNVSLLCCEAQATFNDQARGSVLTQFLLISYPKPYKRLNMGKKMGKTFRYRLHDHRLVMM